jgi:hypothetical protein
VADRAAYRQKWRPADGATEIHGLLPVDTDGALIANVERIGAPDRGRFTSRYADRAGVPASVRFRAGHGLISLRSRAWPMLLRRPSCCGGVDR